VIEVRAKRRRQRAHSDPLVALREHPRPYRTSGARR
jgi:hypothetical protein